MPTVLTGRPKIETLADVLHRLGDIPPDRIRWHPHPGTATEADLLELDRHTGRVYELVDGVLVEKAMAWIESRLAGFLLYLINSFVIPRNLGVVTGEQGMFRIFAGLVRIPDVAFTSWDRMPGRRLPTEPIPDLVPDLAVEVLSPSNTQAEMDRKRIEYFAAKVQLLWIIDPRKRTVTVYTSSDAFVVLEEADTLDGGTLLPGFSIALKDLFGELDRNG